MGSWGYRPEDNDDAHDALAALRVEDRLVAYWKKKSKRRCDEAQHKWVRIGVLRLLARAFPIRVPKYIVSDAIDDLVTLLGNDEWLETWDDKRGVVLSINESLAWLRTVLRQEGRSVLVYNVDAKRKKRVLVYNVDAKRKKR